MAYISIFYVVNHLKSQLRWLSRWFPLDGIEKVPFTPLIAPLCGVDESLSIPLDGSMVLLSTPLDGIKGVIFIPSFFLYALLTNVFSAPTS